MTTKVSIGIVQEHMPIVVEVVRSDGTVAHTITLHSVTAQCQEYVHSGQTLRVREMTTAEQHNGVRV